MENLLWRNRIHYWVPNFILIVRFSAFYEYGSVRTSRIILQAPDNVCSNHNPDNCSMADLTVYRFRMIRSVPTMQLTSHTESIISLSLFSFHLTYNKMTFVSILSDQLCLLRFLFTNRFFFDQVQERYRFVI